MKLKELNHGLERTYVRFRPDALMVIESWEDKYDHFGNVQSTVVCRSIPSGNRLWFDGQDLEKVDLPTKEDK